MLGWLRKMMGGARKPAPPPVASAPPLPEPPLEGDALRLALERPCAPVVFRKPANIDPFATMFGVVRVCGKDEAWPHFDGAPMWPLCQLNLTQSPLAPDALRDLSLITIYIAPQHSHRPTRIIDTSDLDPEATWALRAYEKLDGLTIPKEPAHGSTLSPRMGEWAEVCADYPNVDMSGHVIDPNEYQSEDHDWWLTVDKTKLGGWPGTVQSEPWWASAAGADTWDFVLQIENEPKAGWYGWGDGAAYLARSRQRPHLWAIDVQFT